MPESPEPSSSPKAQFSLWVHRYRWALLLVTALLGAYLLVWAYQNSNYYITPWENESQRIQEQSERIEAQLSPNSSPPSKQPRPVGGREKDIQKTSGDRYQTY